MKLSNTLFLLASLSALVAAPVLRADEPSSQPIAVEKKVDKKVTKKIKSPRYMHDRKGHPKPSPSPSPKPSASPSPAPQR